MTSMQGSGPRLAIVPSIFFVLTPIVAVGMLLCCNVALANRRRREHRRLLAEAGHSGKKAKESVPVMYEIWINKRRNSTYLESDGHNLATLDEPASGDELGGLSGLLKDTAPISSPLSLQAVATPSSSYNVGALILMPTQRAFDNEFDALDARTNLHLALTRISGPPPDVTKLNVL